MESLPKVIFTVLELQHYRTHILLQTRFYQLCLQLYYSGHPME